MPPKQSKTKGCKSTPVDPECVAQKTPVTESAPPMEHFRRFPNMVPGLGRSASTPGTQAAAVINPANESSSSTGVAATPAGSEPPERRKVKSCTGHLHPAASGQDCMQSSPTDRAKQQLLPATAMRPSISVTNKLMDEQSRSRRTPDWLYTCIADPAAVPLLKLMTVHVQAVKTAYASQFYIMANKRATAEDPLAASDFLTVLQMNACSLTSQLDRLLPLMPRLRLDTPPLGDTQHSRRAAVPAYFEWRRQFIEFLSFVAEAFETYFLQRVHHGVMEWRRVVFTICRRLPRPLAAVALPAMDLFDDGSAPIVDMLTALDGHFCSDPARAEEVCGILLRVIQCDVKAKRLSQARADCKIATILDEFRAACVDVQG